MQPSHLIHLAWEAVPPTCYVSINNYYWLTSSISLIQHFTTCGGKRVVVAGTGAEYEWFNGVLFEDSPLLSYKTPYSLCKMHYTPGSKRTPSKPVSACVGAAFFICMVLTNKEIDSFLTSSLPY